MDYPVLVNTGKRLSRIRWKRNQSRRPVRHRPWSGNRWGRLERNLATVSHPL